MHHSIQPPMTVDEYLEWCDRPPHQELIDGKVVARHDTKYELVAGEFVPMSPQRATSVRLKMEIHQALRDAIAAKDLPCQVWPSGASIWIDGHSVSLPESLVAYHRPLISEIRLVPDPVIVAKIVSAPRRGYDAGGKLLGYLGPPRVRHHLLFKTERPAVIHHHRRADDTIKTRILTSGKLQLRPSGIEIDIDAMYSAANADFWPRLRKPGHGQVAFR